jgi:hypothetical protein
VRFPILEEGRPSIPWEAIEPHRAQAYRNHYQTLERLAKRGGLSYFEVYCVLNDIPWINAEHEFKRYERAGMELVQRLNS